MLCYFFQIFFTQFTPNYFFLLNWFAAFFSMTWLCFVICTQNHLVSLKTMLIRLQTQSRFLENVAKEDWSSPDNIEMRGRLYDIETYKYLVYRICIWIKWENNSYLQATGNFLLLLILLWLLLLLLLLLLIMRSCSKHC